MTWYVIPVIHNWATWRVLIILITNHICNVSTFLRVCHSAFMWSYAVSKPTKLKLVREVKMGNSGSFKSLRKNDKTNCHGQFKALAFFFFRFCLWRNANVRKQKSRNVSPLTFVVYNRFCAQWVHEGNGWKKLRYVLLYLLYL